MTRVLVTGATGLIGRHAVADLVERGLDVHGVVRTRPCDFPENMTWHEADLLDPGEAQRVVQEAQATHLLHLAWVTEHGEFWGSLDNKLWLTVSQRLIDAFVAQDGKRVVVSGSCAEYDWTQLGDGICREDETPLKPHTLYGQCKVALSNWLLNRTDVRAAWGRVFLLYGEGEAPKRLVPDVARALVDGAEAKCSSGTQIRDFMDARDVGRGFAALLMSDVTGPVNVASGEAVTIAEVANTLGQLAGRADLVKLGAYPDRADDPPKLIANVERLNKEVGFTPLISLRDGLKAVLDGFV
ncbi:NAD(P)-dependent oxidoreductase [Magnetovibrio sp. PR-2]|uniref:NAD-dependent epimerase/dehydratase family protein n=1 Tax=Magnetovibrio sp. PR-2 TaxID=3120356 RepID=UPI002FCDF1E7